MFDIIIWKLGKKIKKVIDKSSSLNNWTELILVVSIGKYK